MPRRDNPVFRILGLASRPLTRTVSHLTHLYLLEPWHALDMLKFLPHLSVLHVCLPSYVPYIA
jgi:hypothetical protein